MRAALRTGPLPVTETQMFIDILTYRTSLAGGIETVNPDYTATILGRRVLQFLHE